MNRVLLIVGGVLVGLLAALFAVPTFVDWTRYRGVFEEEASRLLGREVRVGGQVNLRLLPSPYVRIEKVRIADTLATVGEPLFRADDLTIWLAIAPLFRGAIEASSIELRKPVVTLVLDEQGSGNWSSLAERPIGSAFIPSHVSFDQISLTDGAVAILGARGEEKSRLEHINGELSAAAIDGPYRLHAAFLSDGLPREVRLSTGKAEPDGSIRLKGTLRAQLSGVSYVVEGMLADIFGKPRLTGELTAKLPLPAEPASKGSTDSYYELKSLLAANAAGAQLTDITLSFEQNGRPQLAMGGATISWQPRMRIAADLSSKWLDLDRMGGRSSTMSMPELLRRFAMAIDEHMPPGVEASLKLTLEQATLGGDVISGVQVSLARNGTALRIDAAAGLPGSTRLQLSGAIAGASPSALFSGDVSLRGANLTRFAAWAARNTSLPEAKQDSSFAMKGRLAVGRDQVAGRDLVVELAGINVSGDAAWSFAGPAAQISLSLEGSELDLSALLDGQASAAALMRLLGDKLLSGHAVKTMPDLPGVAARLRVGRLVAGQTAFRDVVADFRISDGNIVIPLLRVGLESGLALELQGDIARLALPGSKGSIAFSVAADSLTAVSDLAKLAGGDVTAILDERRAKGMLPLRLAGQLRVGELAPGTSEVSFDGRLGQTRASGSVAFEPRGHGWREGHTDLALTLDGADAGRLLELVMPSSLSISPNPAAQAPGRIVLRGVGTAKGGLVSLVALETATQSSEFRGRLAVTDDANLAVDGNIRVGAADLASLLQLAGGRERPSLAGLPMQGVIAIAGTIGQQRFDFSRLRIGNAQLSGRLAYEGSPTGPRLKGTISSTVLSMPQLLDALTVGSRGVRASSARTSNWSDDLLDFAGLTSADVQVRIEASNLALSPDITVTSAAIEATAKDGRIEAKLVEGAALGGKARGKLRLERGAVGFNAIASLSLAGAKLESAGAPGGPVAASGQLGFKLELESSGSSPRGLIAALRGKGELFIAHGRLNRMAPSSVRDAVNAFIAQKGETPEGELRRHLETSIGTVGPAIGQRTLALTVSDGIVKLAPLSIEAADGRIIANTTVDLEALRIDSEWRIEPADDRTRVRSQKQGKPVRPLPGIQVVYVGPLSQVGLLEPRVQFEELEREITVRRMERDLEELEQLRRQDEERAHQEPERIRLPLEPRQSDRPMREQVPLPVPAAAPSRNEAKAAVPGVPDAAQQAPLKEPGLTTSVAAPVIVIPVTVPHVQSAPALPGPAAAPAPPNTGAPSSAPVLIAPSEPARPSAKADQLRKARQPARDVFRELGGTSP